MIKNKIHLYFSFLATILLLGLSACKNNDNPNKRKGSDILSLTVNSLRAQGTVNSINTDAADKEDQVNSLQVISQNQITGQTYYENITSSNFTIGVKNFSTIESPYFIANMPKQSWDINSVINQNLQTLDHIAPPFVMTAHFQNIYLDNGQIKMSQSSSAKTPISGISPITEVLLEKSVAKINVRIKNDYDGRHLDQSDLNKFNTTKNVKLVKVELLNVPKTFGLINPQNAPTLLTESEINGNANAKAMYMQNSPSDFTTTPGTKTGYEENKDIDVSAKKIYVPEYYPSTKEQNMMVRLTLQKTEKGETETKTFIFSVGSADENNHEIMNVKRNTIYNYKINMKEWNGIWNIIVDVYSAKWDDYTNTITFE